MVTSQHVRIVNNNIGNWTGGRSFSPKGGVLITDKEGAGIVTTCSAVVYLSEVKKSVAMLEEMTASDVALLVETSLVHAETIRERVLTRLRSHIDLLERSSEVVFGVIYFSENENTKRVFAVGIRTVTGQKGKTRVSKETRLIRSLPVGRRSIYALTDNARLHEIVGTSTPKKYAYGAQRSIGLAEIFPKKRTHVVIISDSAHFRKYAGMSFITREAMWEEWNSGGVFDGASIIMCRSGGAEMYTPEQLASASYKDVYSKETAYSNLEHALPLLGKALKASGGSISLTIYLTDLTYGLNEMAKRLRTYFELGYNIAVSLKRYGMSGRSAMRSLYWHIGDKSKTSADWEAAKLKDVMETAGVSFGITESGVEIGENRIQTYYTLHPMSVAELAEILGINPENLLVYAKKSSKPPYLLGRNYTIMMTGSSQRPLSTIAARPASLDEKIESNTYVRYFLGDIGLLLANA